MNQACRILLFCICCLPALPSVATAQQSRKLIAGGNMLYEAGKFKEAAVLYDEALKTKPNTKADTALLAKGAYNLGNALYQLKQNETARKAYEVAARKAGSKQEQTQADYNIGNTYMQERKWEEAIEAYKRTLRNNPQDADAKYNLSYAKAMLKKEGGGGKDKNKDKDKKDQDKDQQNKDKNKEQDNKDQKDQQDKQDQGQPKDEQKDQQEQQHPQPQPSKLSEKQAEQLLNALQQEEKKLQDKNKKATGTPVRMEKDW